MRKRNSKSIAHVPKGPSIFYFIKNGKAMSDPDKILNVFRDIVAKYGMVTTFMSGLKQRTYLVADDKIAHEIFTSPKLFPKYPNLVADITKLQSLIGKGLLAIHSNEEWKKHRKEMVGAFKPSIVLRQYHPIIVKQLYQLFDKVSLKSDDSVTNISEIGILFSGRIISELLSPYHDLKIMS